MELVIAWVEQIGTQSWRVRYRTGDGYRSVLRCHILLRWGATPLHAITALGVNKWISDLRQLGYANTTVATIVKVLSMILTDAADEHLISTNPIRRYRRRGRRSHRIERERVWASPNEVLRIAEQAAALGGETADRRLDRMPLG